MNRPRRNRDLNGQLTAPTADRICAPDFVVRTGFHEVDKFGRDSSFSIPLRRVHVPNSLLAFGTKRQHILKSGPFAAMRSNSFEELVFPAKSAKDRVRRKRAIFPGLTPNLAPTGNLPNCLAKAMYFSMRTSSLAFACNRFGAYPASATASPQRSQMCGYHSDIFTAVARSKACRPGAWPPFPIAMRLISATICCLFIR